MSSSSNKSKFSLIARSKSKLVPVNKSRSKLVPVSKSDKKSSSKPKKIITKRTLTKLTAYVQVVNDKMETKWKKIWVTQYNKSIHNKAYERPGGPRLVAKRGEKLAHHFAYYSKDQAGILNDPWYQSKRVGGSKGQWHSDWQELSDPEYVEVIKQKDGIKHIADLVGKNDEVIELQHSPMTHQEIQQREQFYDNMIWVIDATTAEHFVAGSTRLSNGIRNFYAIKMEDWWGFTTKTIYLDIGKCLVRPMFMSRRWLFGYIVQYKTFINNRIYYQPIENVEQKYEKADIALQYPDGHSFMFKDNQVILGGNNYSRREKLKAEGFRYNGEHKTWSIIARHCPPCYVRPDPLAYN